MTSLNGWHRGERIVRQKLGFDKVPGTSMLFSTIGGEMPEQHSTFYTTRIPFLPVCILDEDNRPWGSVLTGKNGQLGFVHNPRYNTLNIDAQLWNGDPFVKYLQNDHPSPLIAGIGVELSTRRRNKFAGSIIKVAKNELAVQFELVVNEALGNCPKYITLREMVPHPSAPVVVEDVPHAERLSPAAIAFILASDTVFLGTTYTALPADSTLFPSHLGMNHRGGRPGFIRVNPTDQRTVVLPDYSGNRYMTSLGNVEATPRASLTFISFTSGHVLYITGTARNLYGPAARAVMPFQATLTEICTTGYTLVHNALPVVQNPNAAPIQPSPYSPPIRLLAAEPQSTALFAAQPVALLTSITPHSADIATFAFEVEAGASMRISPGQAVILDFSSLLGARQYQHMSARKPSLVNDDFVRTWTVSHSSSWSSPNESMETQTPGFSLTMREKPEGVVTGALFSIMRKLLEGRKEEGKKEQDIDIRDLEIRVSVVGIYGEFALPLSSSPSLSLPKSQQQVVVDTSKLHEMLWIAGGIGVTPFLAMLAALSTPSSSSSRPNITLIISTRDPPHVILTLLARALGVGTPIPAWLAVHIFSSSSTPTDSVSVDPQDVREGVKHTLHAGRIPSEFFTDKSVFSRPLLSHSSNSEGEESTKTEHAEGEKERESSEPEIYVCGSQPFESAVMAGLRGAGVDTGRVKKEGFAY